MIAMTVVGLGMIFVLAGVVGVVDVMRAATWRRVAAERRERWVVGQAVVVGPAEEFATSAPARGMQPVGSR